MKKFFVTLLLLAVTIGARCQQTVDFTNVAAKTIDAVVHIKTEIARVTPMYRSYFGIIINQGMQRQRFDAYGSGVIISTDGYIVTNNHVVQDAEKITVTLNDKRVLPARLVGHDPATDLAVIKVDANGLTFIPFGNSDEVRIGEPVMAIGNPFNLTSTVTAGIISAKARNMDIIRNNNSGESTIDFRPTLPSTAATREVPWSTPEDSLSASTPPSPRAMVTILATASPSPPTSPAR